MGYSPVSKASVIARLIVALAVFTLLPGCSSKPASTGDATILKIGIVPYDAPDKLQAQYTPFADYIAGKAGKTAQVFVAQDYVGVVQALQADQIDAAYLNPLSYVLFDQRMRNTPEHLIPLAMPEVHGSLYYYGVILTRTDTGIKNIQGLKGKKMAFSEPTSTSGYLYPYQYMLAHGVNPDKDLGQKVFAGTPAVIPALLNHTVDAGAVFEEGITMFANPEQRKQLVVLARVGPIANGMFVVRGNLDPVIVAKLRAALVSINTDPAAKSAMTKLQVTRWDPADDSVFDPVRKVASVLNLQLTSLTKKK
jgi:phosphonate transport system substrate-binding protein